MRRALFFTTIAFALGPVYRAGSGTRLISGWRAHPAAASDIKNTRRETEPIAILLSLLLQLYETLTGVMSIYATFMIKFKLTGQALGQPLQSQPLEIRAYLSRQF
jgi:hypothetical protein